MEGRFSLCTKTREMRRALQKESVEGMGCTEK